MSDYESLDIPDRFNTVAYVSSRTPEVSDPENLDAGANCQLYAYELLRHFGKIVPDFRSSEQWEDSTFSITVNELKPLDLMFYNDEPKAYGAHVGVYVGNSLVLHLSKENGTPKIEKHTELMKNKKYTVFVGAKRFIKTNQLERSRVQAYDAAQNYSKKIRDHTTLFLS